MSKWTPNFFDFFAQLVEVHLDKSAGYIFGYFQIFGALNGGKKVSSKITMTAKVLFALLSSEKELCFPPQWTAWIREGVFWSEIHFSDYAEFWGDWGDSCILYTVYQLFDYLQEQFRGNSEVKKHPNVTPKQKERCQHLCWF